MPETYISPKDKTHLPFETAARQKPYVRPDEKTISDVYRDIQERPLKQNDEPHLPFI